MRLMGWDSGSLMSPHCLGVMRPGAVANRRSVHRGFGPGLKSRSGYPMAFRVLLGSCKGFEQVWGGDESLPRLW